MDATLPANSDESVIECRIFVDPVGRARSSFTVRFVKTHISSSAKLELHALTARLCEPTLRTSH